MDDGLPIGQIQQVLQRDPRYRPHRAFMWVVYLLAIALPVGAMVYSIGKNLSGGRSPVKREPPTRAVARVCAEEIDALHRDLNQRAWRLGGEIGAADAVARFNAWSVEWEQRLEDLGERCRLDRTDADAADYAGRLELGRARDAVLALHRAYRAQVNRFALEQAELAQAAALAVEQARQRTTVRN